MLNLTHNNVYMRLATETTGPTAVLKGQAKLNDIKMACAVVARYCDKDNVGESVIFSVESGAEEVVQYRVLPLDADELNERRI